MDKVNRYISFVFYGLVFQLLLVQLPILAGGAFGAEIFCSMREGGNEHENSWEAAYAYIKRQKGGVFKISPKQAAGQIVETVVRERDKFEYCLPYLSELYPKRIIKDKKGKDKDLDSIDKTEEFDRYSY